MTQDLSNPSVHELGAALLQAIEIMGGDKTQGLGAFKGQSYLIAQFQYNFNLM